MFEGLVCLGIDLFNRRLTFSSLATNVTNEAGVAVHGRSSRESPRGSEFLCHRAGVNAQ